MRRILIGTIAAGFALTSFGAMAQTAAPVPNASGSQVTNPNSKGSTANEYLGKQDTTPGAAAVAPAAPLTTGTVAPVPNASGSQVTNPAGTSSSPSVVPMMPGTAGTVAPVPNASGSQVTNPAGTGSTTVK
ncbi:hypothetical protein [Microvirga pudoricolor]|uniref:hypothetical protein n=1 Tax=Microvirga pudoricolor TaxID=2778729 RepID=UPI001950D54E|nr:hypothetical protein [Microvirga pudoricolor]MBM6592686.1 hypothetical protein [Microvirga pudoricolor]